MKNRRHTPEQIIRNLRQADQLLGEGSSAAEVARQLGVSEQTYYRWRNQYGGMKADDAKRLKELEKENARLEKIVADQALDIDIRQGRGAGNILTPGRRRRAVIMAQECFGVSQRRACTLLDQPRSTQRSAPTVLTPFEERLRAWLRAFALAPTLGMAAGLLRLARRGLDRESQTRPAVVARGGPARACPGTQEAPRGAGVIGAFCPIHPNVLWAMDFQFDQTSDGRNLKLLNIIDEFTREALATEVERPITADMVVATLERLVGLRGAPAYLRFDNGPEFVATVVADWAKDYGAALVFSDPGTPWQNGWVESFNGRMRDELLNGERFDSLLEAKVVINDWRHDYNINRPHSALANLTPAAYSVQWHTRQNVLANSHS